MRIAIITTALITSAAGCTNQDVYDNFQRDKARRCLEVPESQYEQCMQEASVPYEEYNRDRVEYLEEQQK